MASFTLDDIRTASEAKYGSTDIDLPDGTKVRLLNALRLSSDDRASLKGMQARLDQDDADEAVILADAIRTVADTEVGARKLLEAVGDDLATLATIFEKYSEGSSLGEASASES